ncbi:glutathione S-transferase family protein [Parvularcula sp. ZS-1/3]|uniref:Glutathione S-transferase family protein n=1 Tax=Parvularcula mediterranea TaxID=2732508 RepID=A0A7Y3RIU6_9PROT|nr:glutathione S-transferase family protein [Parvularcula mediterranea]NNU14821.1 glutathione S-transferase family protein [Parvularcula mediterranea]
MTLDFYTNPMSRGQIARWALEETGAPYNEHIISYGPEMKGEAYLAINPMGKVPALKHNGAVVTEAAAICAYLASAFPQSGLAPSAEESADYHRWMFFAAGPMESAISFHSAGFKPTKEQTATFGFGSYEMILDVVKEKLSRDSYACGERFAMADVYLGSQIGFGTQFGTLPKEDVFTAYIERLANRDAFKKAKARDAALIAEMQASKSD